MIRHIMFINFNGKYKVETVCIVKLIQCVEAYWPTLVELVLSSLYIAYIHFGYLILGHTDPALTQIRQTLT